MPISARLVLIGLYEIAHRVSSPRFYAKESTLRALFCLDRKTLQTALVAIVKARQLRHTPGAKGNPSEFWLYNPTTGFLFPEQDGRATPTYNGVSRGKRAQAAAIAERPQTAKPRQEQPIRIAAEQPTATETRIDCDALPATAPQQIQARPKRLCHIPSHTTIHYRLDGSELCGDCHPTGITVPPSAGFSEPHKSPMPFTPPTAEELGFSSR